MPSPSLPDIPADDPSRTFPKRGLPQSFASTYAHGQLSGHPRNERDLRNFEARKATILRSMDAEQIEVAYQETVKNILKQVEEDRKTNEEIDRDLEMREAQRDLERRIYRRQKEERAARRVKVEEGKDEMET